MPARAPRRFFRVLLITIAAVALSPPAPGGQGGDTTRRIWDESVESATKAPSQRRAPRRRYRVATAKVAPADVASETVVGVTVWRLREARARDRGERLLVVEGGSSAQWIPERVSADSRLSEGDRVRLSLEAARTGYLYVVDREEYADGTRSDPYLVFPNTKVRGGRNDVTAGRVTEIPARDDPTPYFTLRRGRADQVGETLSVIVTSEPIPGVEPGPDPIKLSEAQVAEWEKTWGANVGRLELEGGAGAAWTKQEKEAGDGARPLAADAPPPQSVYYRPGAKPGDPLFAEVRLSYAAPRARRQK